MKEHCDSNRKGSILNNAILKYSPHNFDITILIETDNEKLDEFKIKYLKARPKQYQDEGYSIPR
jgi:hypothetical protein